MQTPASSSDPQRQYAATRKIGAEVLCVSLGARRSQNHMIGSGQTQGRISRSTASRAFWSVSRVSPPLAFATVKSAQAHSGATADSYLIVITDSDQVASLPEPRSKVHAQVRRANTVVAIPLKSHDRAQQALKKQVERQQSRRRRVASSIERKGATKRDEAGSATTTDDETDSSDADEADADTPPVPSSETSGAKRPFWKRALSKLDSPTNARKEVPSSSDEVAPEAPTDPGPSTDATEAPASDLADVTATATEQPAQVADETILASQRELDAKLVAECLRLMTGLYFSHTTDITRALQSKHEKDDPLRHTPARRLAERRYWYNENLMTPFVQAGVRLGDPFTAVLV